MKTFKVAEFYLLKEDKTVEIPFQDGLIINREDEKKTWLIELFLTKEAEQIVRPFAKEQPLTARIAITHRGNDPAFFAVSIRSFQQLECGISVLFDALLLQMRNEYAKQVLTSLLGQGLEGTELLEVFTDTIRRRPAVSDN